MCGLEDKHPANQTMMRNGLNAWLLTPADESPHIRIDRSEPGQVCSCSCGTGMVWERPEQQDEHS